jgi:serine/threonine protein kinase
MQYMLWNKSRKLRTFRNLLRVLIKKSIESILNEKTLLSKLINPFIINMKCSFQDVENLYIALDYMSGGDLRYHLFTKVNFS